MAQPIWDVWAVHVTVNDNAHGPHLDVPIDYIASTKPRAMNEARIRSNNEEVIGAAVTRFTVDDPGNRHRVALWVDGVQQILPHYSDNDLYIPG